MTETGPGSQLKFSMAILSMVLSAMSVVSSTLLDESWIIPLFVDSSASAPTTSKPCTEELTQFLNSKNCSDRISRSYYSRCFEVCHANDHLPVPLYHSCPVALECNVDLTEAVVSAPKSLVESFYHFPPGNLRSELFKRFYKEYQTVESFFTIDCISSASSTPDKYTDVLKDDLAAWYNEKLRACRTDQLSAHFDLVLRHPVQYECFAKMIMPETFTVFDGLREDVVYKLFQLVMSAYSAPLPGTERLFSVDSMQIYLKPYFISRLPNVDFDDVIEKLISARPLVLIHDHPEYLVTGSRAQKLLEALKSMRVCGSAQLYLSDGRVIKLIQTCLGVSELSPLEKSAHELFYFPKILFSSTPLFSYQSSIDALYAPLPADIYSKLLPLIPSVVSKAEWQSWASSSGPSNPRTFFRVITGGDTTKFFTTLYHMRTFMSKAEYQGCIDFASIVVNEAELLKARIRSQRNWLMRKPFAENTINMKQRYLLHSLMFNHGCFGAHINGELKSMFKLLAKLYFPWEYAQLEAVTRLPNQSIGELFSCPFVEKGWLLEHFAVLTSDDKVNGIMSLFESDTKGDFVNYVHKLFADTATYDPIVFNLKRRIGEIISHLVSIGRFADARELLNNDSGVEIDEKASTLSFSKKPSNNQVYVAKTRQEFDSIIPENIPIALIVPVIAFLLSGHYNREYVFTCERHVAIRYIQDMLIKPWLANAYTDEQEADEERTKLILLFSLLKRYDSSSDPPIACSPIKLPSPNLYPTIGDLVSGLCLSLEDGKRLLIWYQVSDYSYSPRVDGDPSLRMVAHLYHNVDPHFITAEAYFERQIELYAPDPEIFLDKDEFKKAFDALGHVIDEDKELWPNVEWAVCIMKPIYELTFKCATAKIVHDKSSLLMTKVVKLHGVPGCSIIHVHSSISKDQLRRLLMERVPKGRQGSFRIDLYDGENGFVSIDTFFMRIRDDYTN